MQVGSVFQSYAAFCLAKQKYETDNFTNFVHAVSTKLKASRKISAAKVEQFVYSRVILRCKYYGKCNSTAQVRQTKTYKQECPVMIDIRLQNNGLVIVKVNLAHENHVPTRATYNSLPRQRRKTIDNLKDFVDNTLKVKPSFRSVQQNVNQAVGVVGKVIQKDLYNEKARQNKIIQDEENVGDLHSLVSEMKKIQNATVKVVTNNQNEVKGIYFQDAEMKKQFAAFPEILYVDATYNVNSHNMPLQVAMVSDGDGESQIVALFIIRSENIAVMTALFNQFVLENEKCNETEIVMVDKHASNIATFRNVLPAAKIHICIFHVMQIFKREVTPRSRNITENTKNIVLRILQQMIYTTNEEQYNGLYAEMQGVASDELMQYFDNQWHNGPIRSTWAGYIVTPRHISPIERIIV